MRATRKESKKLHDILTEVYRQKQTAPVDDRWQAEVLRRAHRINRSREKPSAVKRWFQAPFRQWVPAAGLTLAIALLAAVLLMNDTGNEQPDLSAMNDPVEVVVAQLFWP